MQRITHPSASECIAICRRPTFDRQDLSRLVRDILSDVKANGDSALFAYAKKFDRVDLSSLIIEREALLASSSLLSSELRAAIELAANNIRVFHQSQISSEKVVETMAGVRCWRKSTPISPVGFYVPGGSAPLFSTLLMLAVPAQLAGCKEIVVCSPPLLDGSIHPAILFSAALCGIERVYRVGGAQAIAAMAYGTETIPKVHKIFGPGNQFVTMAKQIVQEDGVGIDMPAGPSEVAVFADESSTPAFVAADLLSQAEHGPDSQVLLVSTSEDVLNKVGDELQQQLAILPRREIAEKSLTASNAVLVRSIEEAVSLLNRYAPEHLILASDRAIEIGEQILNAGSVFLGHFAPESVGDYASGTNHVLPTNGFAAVTAGVSLDSFVKKITFQELSIEGLRQIGAAVCEMARAEGLEAHRRAVEVRLNEGR